MPTAQRSEACSLESRLHQVQTVVVHVRSQLLAAAAVAAVIPTQHVRRRPLAAVQSRHPAQLRHDGVLVRAELTGIHGASRRRLLLLLLWRQLLRRRHAGVMLREVARVRRPRRLVGLRGDAVRRGLSLGGLHARGRAGVRRLRLRPRRGLRRAHLAAERGGGAQAPLALQVGRLGQGLLGAHGAAVLGRGAGTQVLLLQQPLVDVLVQLRHPALLLRPLTRSWPTLARLKRGSSGAHRAPAGTSVLAAHGILLLLLLLLHLDLMLKSLLQRRRHLRH